MSQNNCNCGCCCQSPKSVVSLPLSALRLPLHGMAVDIDADALKGQGQGQCALNLDLYVATTGDDANDGLTPATAMATVHRAAEYLSGIGWIGTATVHIADGTYDGDPLHIGHIVDLTGRVAFDGESRDGTILTFNFKFYQTKACISNLTITNSGRYHVSASQQANVALSNVALQSNDASATVVASSLNSFMALSDCALSGTAGSFLVPYDGGVIYITGAVTFNGACAQVAYVCQGGGIRVDGPTTGNVTGKKYLVRTNGVLVLNGKTLPGSTAGTTETGGQVVA